MENLVKEWCVGRVTSEDKTMDAAYLVYATEHIEGDLYKGYFIDSEGEIHKSENITPEFKADKELRKSGFDAFSKSVNFEAYSIAYQESIKIKKEEKKNKRNKNNCFCFYFYLFFILCSSSLFL